MRVEQLWPLLHWDGRGSLNKVNCTCSGERIREAAAGPTGLWPCAWATPPLGASCPPVERCAAHRTSRRSAPSRLVQAGCSANGGTEPEVVGRALSRTVGLGPHRRLTRRSRQHRPGARGLNSVSRSTLGRSLRRPRCPRQCRPRSHSNAEPSRERCKWRGTSGPQPGPADTACAGSVAQGQGRSAETRWSHRQSWPACMRGDTCAHSIPSLAPRWKGGRDIWGPGLLRRRFNYRFSAAGRWARIGKEGGSSEPCHFPTSAASSKGGIQTFSPQAAEWTVVAPA